MYRLKPNLLDDIKLMRLEIFRSRVKEFNIFALYKDSGKKKHKGLPIFLCGKHEKGQIIRPSPIEIFLLDKYLKILCYL